jgi:hypothetical protein
MEISTIQQDAFARIIKHEIDKPIESIVALNKIGNKVQVNNEFTVFCNFRELEKFILDRTTTIHTLSFFSNPNPTDYNGVFTNSKEYNTILQKMHFLNNQISQETNPSRSDILRLNYYALKKQLDQAKTYFKIKKEDTWLCRHMSFAYILNLFELNLQKASSFFCSDEQKYLHKQIDSEINKMLATTFNIQTQLFTENLTIENLIACKNYLNSKHIFCLDDYFNNALSKIKHYSIDTKLSDIGIQLKDIFPCSLLKDKTGSELTQLCNAINLVVFFSRGLPPVCDHSLNTDMLKYNLSFHSINSLTQYLQRQCHRFYYSSPINHQEKYLLTTESHMVAFKITRQVDAVEILFFDINCGLREKVFRITHGEYHREINILNFIDVEALISYDMLQYNDYDLATMSCYRVNNIEGNL